MAVAILAFISPAIVTMVEIVRQSRSVVAEVTTSPNLGPYGNGPVDDAIPGDDARDTGDDAIPGDDARDTGEATPRSYGGRLGISWAE